jgi:hypothetical protein
MNSTHVTSIRHVFHQTNNRQGFHVDMIRSTTELPTDNTASNYWRISSPYYVTTNKMHFFHFTLTSKSFLYRILTVISKCKFINVTLRRVILMYGYLSGSRPQYGSE